MPFGKPRAERADAVRNRELLLCAARAMVAEEGVERVTMDGLAERAGLGKGTVFRRFGTRAGIFRALLDADEACFQRQVMQGPPPLGPGADPVTRMIAYGRARIAFLRDHHAIVRAAIDRNEPTPAGEFTITRVHLRMLLSRTGLALHDLDSLAVQLTGALEGPTLLYLAQPEPAAPPSPEVTEALADSWQLLVERLTRPEDGPEHTG
ncbi:TetR/AcrR family transcriptional regulator [Streptomyces sp. J2-1]|nr:TetR/AcrR family transcriptional regulator [Streptomyces corallincola]